jgi:hypothetical protein
MEMNRKFKVFAAVSCGMLLTLLVLLVSVRVSAHRSERMRDAESMEIIAFKAQFNYRIFKLISSNQTEKAKNMLEDGILFDLEHLWQLGGPAGISTNPACRETFATIYPDLRQRLSLGRFENLLPTARSNFKRFVKEADAAFMITASDKTTNRPQGERVP